MGTRRGIEVTESDLGTRTGLAFPRSEGFAVLLCGDGVRALSKPGCRYAGLESPRAGQWKWPGAVAG